MKNREKVLDDIARVAGGTVNAFSGLTHNIREEIKSRVEEVAARLDLVPREDFDKLEAMLSEARKTQKEQEKRITALEKQVGKKPAAKKTATKKTTTKKKS